MRRQFYRAFFLEIKFFGAPILAKIYIHSDAQKGLILKKDNYLVEFLGKND